MPSGMWPPVAMIFLSDPSGLTENTRPSARSRMNKRLDMCFPFRICFGGAQCEEVTELLLLRAQVGEGLRRGQRLAGNARGDLDAGVGERADLARVVRQQADAANAERVHDRSGQAEIPVLGHESEREIRGHGVEAGILQLVGAQLRHETDAAAFAIVVDDQPAVFRRDEAHREVELRGAIAAQRPEHLAGRALRLQAHERRAAAELAMHERQRAFNAVGAVALEAERLERAPPGRQIGRRNLPYGHSAGAFFAAGMAPLALRPAISAAPNPSSFSTCSLCSPSPGARFAGTLATPCTWIGLLIVEVSLPPTPCSGTTMSFARSCGSLITSCGPRTAPNVTWTPLKTSYQCAIGCAPKTSSRMAESCGMLAISFAGSENRGSVRRSGRPMASATAASLSEVTSSTNQMSSAVRYTFIAAFAGFLRSCRPKNFASDSAAWIETLAAQTPCARSEVVT